MPRAAAAPARTKTKSLYGVHPGVAMVQDWIAKLKEKTGRTLEEWMQEIKVNGPAGNKERRAWLKSQHKLGTNSAWWLADRAEGKGSEDDSPESYLQAAEKHVEAMFSGNRAGLRPIYDRLLQIGLKLASDVKACPCQTIVPLYRKHVFAQIKPSTNTRIDLGFALGKTKTPQRLINTGGFEKKDRITHRIPIASLSEIDDEVRRWLKIAYDLDA